MAPAPISPHNKEVPAGTKPARRRKRGRPKAKNPASVYQTIRISPAQKERLEKRAQTSGCSVSEYIRQVVLADLDEQGPPDLGPIPGQTTVEEQVAAAAPANPDVAAEVQEAKLTDDPAREAFIARRTLQLYGQGRTKRLARSEAEAEWRRRGTG